MDVLYTKEKRKSFLKIRDSKISFTTFTRTSSNQDSIHASGDGDCARCCRLCGGESSLKFFRDTYGWEGVESRYDQLLYDCFGVQVTSSECMICDCCIKSLRDTERFRALVLAAFDTPTSGINMLIDYYASSPSSTHITVKTNSCHTQHIGNKQTKKPMKLEQLMVNKKVETQRKRPVKKFVTPQNSMKTRTIVNCDHCNQKYPVMIINGLSQAFTCSRCKKNGAKNVICSKCNISMPRNILKSHVQLHVKADIRGRTRLRQIESSRTKLMLMSKICDGFKSQKPASIPNNPVQHVINKDGPKCNNYVEKKPETN